jgi:hypothetical protein
MFILIKRLIQRNKLIYHVKYEEGVNWANRINFQLDSMSVGDRKGVS